MLEAVKRYIKDNRFEIFISFFIFTNLFPAWFPQFMYYISFVLIFWKMQLFHPRFNGKTGLFICFIIYLWISSFVGQVFDLRLVLFSIILYLAAPRNSVKWYLYKVKLLTSIFVGFGIATLANFYAKLAGINLVYRDEYAMMMGRISEFSGFCSHSMWTSCAAAFSTMFFISMVFRRVQKNNVQRYACFVMVVISLYITMIGASRSSFFLSLACSLLIIWMQSKKIDIVRNLFAVGLIAVIVTPFLIENSKAMLSKKNGLEITTKNTSRDELWSQRMDEFKSSPVFGIGFAAHGVGVNKKVGRYESGGSFIAVLAQSGIIGILFIFIIWLSAMQMPSSLGYNSDMIVVYAGFAFMSIHSIVEGYMFQAGWYLCLIIWLTLGVMIEHKQMKNKLSWIAISSRQ